MSSTKGVRCGTSVAAFCLCVAAAAVAVPVEAELEKSCKQ